MGANKEENTKKREKRHKLTYKVTRDGKVVNQ